MSDIEEQIGPGHVFTVLQTRNEPASVVVDGDQQAWNPADGGSTGTLVVTRGKETVAYWTGKTFKVDRFDCNRYTNVSTTGGVTTTTTLLFERGRHATLHSRVWMLYGTTSDTGAGVGEGGGDPGGGWGGQNLR